jgi:hypothetical protein
MLSTEFIPYNSANEATFRTVFLPEEYREGVYSIQECLDLVQYIVEKVRYCVSSCHKIEINSCYCGEIV